MAVFRMKAEWRSVRLWRVGDDCTWRFCRVCGFKIDGGECRVIVDYLVGIWSSHIRYFKRSPWCDGLKRRRYLGSFLREHL